VTDYPWVEAAVAAAAFVTACGVLWRKLLRPLVAGVTKIADRIEIVNEVPEKLRDLAVNVEDLNLTVNRIDTRLMRLEQPVREIDERTKTLEPNAGMSMHDRVKRIDEKTQESE
jgi:hypothetical protein